MNEAISAKQPSARARRFDRYWTVENFLWGILILAAIWTRFWNLGYRAQHHDESLHSYYSWIFATGERLYVHHPLMHGPFLFHANALIYKLFGANDTTSRLIPALFGVLIVAMPWLLRSRNLLGRWGALAAGFMLLISPSMLYYTRYIRHDPYMVAGCLLLAIAIFRYFENPQRRWMVTAFASVGFLLTNHELVLATFAIMVAILWGSLLLTHLRPLVPVHVAALLALGLAAWLWMNHPWPPIPWSPPASSALTGSEMIIFLKILGPSILAVIAIVLTIALERRLLLAAVESVLIGAAGMAWFVYAQQWLPIVRDWTIVPSEEHSTFLTTAEFYSALFQHPFVQALLVIVAVFIIGCTAAIRWMLNDNRSEEAVDFLFGQSKPNSVAYGVWHALKDPTGIAIGLFVMVAIWVLLFTTFFTNPAGVGTGTYETNSTLLYWLGQHDVRRGGQPWFYMIILGLQYEWLTVTLALAGAVLLGWRTLRWLIGGSEGPNYLWNVFIVGWYLGMLLVVSWAGEKMPWLIMHIVLPATLVSAWVINAVVEGAIAWWRARDDQPSRIDLIPVAAFVGLITLAFGWFFMMGARTWPVWSFDDTSAFRMVSAAARSSWWQIAIPPLIALAIITLAVWLIGTRKTIYATLAAAMVVMSLFQVHAGFRTAFIDGDVAVDTLIYNTISPDITQFTHDMAALSQELHGDNTIAIAYDSCKMQWPTNWYLKSDEFPNARFTSYPLNYEPEIILVAQDSSVCGWPDKIPGYTAQIYALRVHESENASYRKFAIAPELSPGRSAWQDVEDPHDLFAVIRSIGSSMRYATTPEGQQKLFRQVMFRDQSDLQTIYYMTVWVRNDVLPAYNEIRYGVNHP